MTAMQPRSRQEAQMLGVPAWQIDQMFPQEASGGLLGGLSPDTQSAVNDYAQMDGLLAPQQEERPNRFWQGGEKVRGKDALAGLLAVISDAASTLGGGQGGAIDDLTGRRKSALDEFKEEAKQQRKMQEIMAIGQANGMTPAQIQAQMAGLKLQQPDEFERNAQRAGIAPGTPEYAEAARLRMIPEPFISTTLPNGQFFAGRPSQMGGMMGGGGMADQTPAIEDGYQYTPGPGGRANQANWRQVGGGTGNGVGGFPAR
jgi:hypothetical protein